MEAALRDIDRFKRQKVKDLREIFTNYAVMQIKQCKKVSGTGFHRPNSAREQVRQSHMDLAVKIDSLSQTLLGLVVKKDCHSDCYRPCSWKS